MYKKEVTKDGVLESFKVIKPGETIPEGYEFINMAEILIESRIVFLMYQGACMLWEGYPTGSEPSEQDKLRALGIFLELAIDGYEPSREKLQELRAECLGQCNAE